MNISRIRINEQLGWIRGFHPTLPPTALPRVISLFIGQSSSAINRFSIVLYPRRPTGNRISISPPRNVALFLSFAVCFLSFSSPSALPSLLLFCPLWIIQRGLYPLNRFTGSRCRRSYNLRVPLCTCTDYVYTRASLSGCSWITPSLDPVGEPVNYHDVSRSYCHGNPPARWRTRAIVTNPPFVDYSVTISQITRGIRTPREYPSRVRMLSSN